MAGVRSRYTTPTGPWLLTDVAHVPHTYHDHQVVFKTIFPPVAVGLLWCYPLSNVLRGKPNDAAIITPASRFVPGPAVHVPAPG